MAHHWPARKGIARYARLPVGSKQRHPHLCSNFNFNTHHRDGPPPRTVF